MRGTIRHAAIDFRTSRRAAFAFICLAAVTVTLVPLAEPMTASSMPAP